MAGYAANPFTRLNNDDVVSVKWAPTSHFSFLLQSLLPLISLRQIANGDALSFVFCYSSFGDVIVRLEHLLVCAVLLRRGHLNSLDTQIGYLRIILSI